MFYLVGLLCNRGRRRGRRRKVTPDMAFADPAAIFAKIAFHVHRDRKARARAPEKGPLMMDDLSGPHSQFEIFSG